MKFHGYVPNLQSIFNDIDIMINPVQMGAGLKIKSVEAMANGLPLVTTTHSATGLMKAKGKGF
ncbi:MAG: glycosyltransferase family 4 protein [Saprospiraceae bacterium]|nr:glycosyltransferase family 4 protein [Saprospiraceae bacterium]